MTSRICHYKTYIEHGLVGYCNSLSPLLVDIVWFDPLCVTVNLTVLRHVY